MNWKLLLEALNSQTLCLSCYNKFKRGHFGVGVGVRRSKISFGDFTVQTHKCEFMEYNDLYCLWTQVNKELGLS